MSPSDRTGQAGSVEDTLEEALPEVIAPAQDDLTRSPAELFPLWRQRLRLAALIMLGGFAVFFVRRVYQVATVPFSLSAADWLLFWSHAAVTAIVGLFALLLSSRQVSTQFRLLTAELALFGLPSLLFLVSQYFVSLRSCREFGYLAFSGGSWLVLIIIYALFIPSTLPRAVIVIGGIAAAPLALVLFMFFTSSPVAQVLSVGELADIFLTFLLAAIGGVIGVDKIDLLRREALRAKYLGRYRLRKRIGVGGMGEVYLAEHEMLKRPCVVKLIRPDKVGDERTLGRFQREVQATAQLSHWNTVEVWDYGRTADGTLYYVMEYLPGMSLADIVRREGPLPAERVIYLVLQACDALREAHEAGLVHRDIKPENLFVARRGGVHDVVKILDFGLVKPMAGERDLRLSSEHSIRGSPLFMSPEQAAGHTAADPRSDIYSLGAVMYYALTGRPPFSGDNVIKLAIAHAQEIPVPPSRIRPELPPDVERIVLKCLAKDPAERYQNVVALGQALSACDAHGQWDRERAAQWWGERLSSLPLAAAT